METARELNRRLGRTLRAHRLGHGSSLSELARASGLSKTILGRIEGGDGNPSIETLWRISQALALPSARSWRTRATQRARRQGHSGEQVRADSGMTGWLVHADGRDHRTELYDLEYPKGTDHRSDAHLPGTEEVIVCVQGRIRVGPAGEEAELGPGDAILFAPDAPTPTRRRATPASCAGCSTPAGT